MAEKKNERFSDWVRRWDKEQWDSVEWRTFLASQLEYYEAEIDRLSKLENHESTIEKQDEYIKLLERQLAVLQKTLDVAERYSRPIVISELGGKMKNGRG
jgi:hypothetical protein